MLYILYAAEKSKTCDSILTHCNVVRVVDDQANKCWQIRYELGHLDGAGEFVAVDEFDHDIQDSPGDIKDIEAAFDKIVERGCIEGGTKI